MDKNYSTSIKEWKPIAPAWTCYLAVVGEIRLRKSNIVSRVIFTPAECHKRIKFKKNHYFFFYLLSIFFFFHSFFFFSFLPYWLISPLFCFILSYISKFSSILINYFCFHFWLFPFSVFFLSFAINFLHRNKFFFLFLSFCFASLAQSLW